MVSALVPRASGPGSSPGGRFSKAPETFRARIKSHCKISNLASTELFYSHILKKLQEVSSVYTSPFLDTEVSRVYTSPFLDTDDLYKWLYGPENFPGLSRNGPLVGDIVLCSWARH